MCSEYRPCEYQLFTWMKKVPVLWARKVVCSSAVVPPETAAKAGHEPPRRKHPAENCQMSLVPGFQTHRSKSCPRGPSSVTEYRCPFTSRFLYTSLSSEGHETVPLRRASIERAPSTLPSVFGVALVVSLATSAASAFTRPWVRGKCPVKAFFGTPILPAHIVKSFRELGWSTEFITAFFTWIGVSPGFCARTSPAIPAAMGEAIDVPSKNS